MSRFETAAIAVEEYSQELYGYISDASKDAYGFRCRIDMSGYTFAELEAECDRLTIAVGVECERMQDEQRLAAIEFEMTVTRIREMGNLDYAGAIKWLMDAEQREWIDQGYFEYTNGLKYGYLNGYC